MSAFQILTVQSAEPVAIFVASEEYAFVCFNKIGKTGGINGFFKGMGEGVHRALVEVAMEKGNLNHDEAEEFWEKKKEGGQYVAVSFFLISCPVDGMLT